MCLLATTGLLATFSFHNVQTTETLTLPGARPVIDAGRFESIQAAIDALPAEGGIVRIPAGKFELTEPLRITADDVTVVGAGTATHLINMNESGQPAILVAHPDLNDPQSENKSLWRIRLAHFRVTGNPANRETKDYKCGSGIEARRINEIHIDSVTISYNGGDGIKLDHCYEDPRICDCLITYNKQTGVNLLGCHDIVVSANQFEENQDALHCFDSFNLCMSGNNLDDHLGDGVVIENTYGSVVASNMIEECHGAAIVLARDCYGDTVSANVIAHNGAGVDLRDAHGCAVSANTFTLLKTNAVRIGPDSGRIAVTGNNFSNSYIGEGKVKRGTNDLLAAGLVLEATDHVSISGNVFSSLHTPAIELRGEPSTEIMLDGNVFTEVSSQHKDLKGNAHQGDELFDPIE
jgi:hypothetical protein